MSSVYLSLCFGFSVSNFCVVVKKSSEVSVLTNDKLADILIVVVNNVCIRLTKLLVASEQVAKLELGAFHLVVVLIAFYHPVPVFRFVVVFDHYVQVRCRKPISSLSTYHNPHWDSLNDL